MTSARNSNVPDSVNHIIKLKKELNIKVIEPFTSDIIEFDNIEQFNDYINRDLEKYTSLTTQKLNKMFHVPGYRITKIHKEIGLRKTSDTSNGCLMTSGPEPVRQSHDVVKPEPEVTSSYKDTLTALKDMVETLINEVSRIDSELNALKSCLK